MKHKPIGIIGGMGPYASAYFYRLLLQKSTEDYGAKNNDDYPEIVIDSVPVPDFISDTQKLPLAKSMVLDRAKKLVNFGCDVVGMACNTGHILTQELDEATSGRFVSMIDLVAAEVRERNYKRVGIMATPVTIKSRLYDTVLNKVGVKHIYPDKQAQKRHEEIVRDVIAGKNGPANATYLEAFTQQFIEQNKLDGIILGCTELPLVFPKHTLKNIIDSMEVLADELLKQYYSQ